MVGFRQSQVRPAPVGPAQRRAECLQGLAAPNEFAWQWRRVVRTERLFVQQKHLRCCAAHEPHTTELLSCSGRLKGMRADQGSGGAWRPAGQHRSWFGDSAQVADARTENYELSGGQVGPLRSLRRLPSWPITQPTYRPSNVLFWSSPMSRSPTICCSQNSPTSRPDGCCWERPE